MPNKHIVILASGGGSNAKCIIDYLHKYTDHRVIAIFTNKKNAGVLEKAAQASVPAFYHKGSHLAEELLAYSDQHKVDAIVLAGYLRLIPQSLIEKYPYHMVNIHPALLPDYGGKGMYGMHVHTAVFESNEVYTGMTIHLVNAEYDKGEILLQAKVNVEDCTDPSQIAARVLRLEHFHYPRVIRTWLDGLSPPV